MGHNADNMALLLHGSSRHGECGVAMLPGIAWMSKNSHSYSSAHGTRNGTYKHGGTWYWYLARAVAHWFGSFIVAPGSPVP